MLNKSGLVKKIRKFDPFILISLFLVLSTPLQATFLTVSCPSQEEITFKVEIAQTPKEREMGLMSRKKLDENAGMRFRYFTPGPVSMWMKNTLIPLDMIFVGVGGKILAIYENTTPHSLKQLGPVNDTTDVLEVNAGIVRKHGITKSCTMVLEKEE